MQTSKPAPGPHLPVARMCSRWGLLWMLHTPMECLLLVKTGLPSILVSQPLRRQSSPPEYTSSVCQ